MELRQFAAVCTMFVARSIFTAYKNYQALFDVHIVSENVYHFLPRFFCEILQLCCALRCYPVCALALAVVNTNVTRLSHYDTAWFVSMMGTCPVRILTRQQLTEVLYLGDLWWTCCEIFRKEAS